jgi:hypothetical protein
VKSQGEYLEGFRMSPPVSVLKVLYRQGMEFNRAELDGTVIIETLFQLERLKDLMGIILI